MPTKRRKKAARRIDRITDAQRLHLICGHYFFDYAGEADHFVDDEHRRSTWAIYRGQILEAWEHPGERPIAMWEYDLNLKRRPYPKEWSWPRPIQTEAEMVYRLLEAGKLESCRFNGDNPIKSELEEIERAWLGEIGLHVGHRDTVPKISLPLTMRGTPVWFYRKHARRIHAESQAELAKYRAALSNRWE